MLGFMNVNHTASRRFSGLKEGDGRIAVEMNNTEIS